MLTPAERWTEQARYDLDTARAMLDSGRYLYVLFCCQQAVEKTLKGLIVEKTGEFPPRLHNLPKLAEHAGVQLDKGRALQLRQLSGYYVQTRYPDEIAEASCGVSRGLAREVMSQTEAMLQWLSLML